MLYIDSLGQIKGGLSERNLIIRFKKDIFVQQQVLHKLWHPKKIINQPPDHILGWFLYESDLKNPAKIDRALRIDRKPQHEPKSPESRGCEFRVFALSVG